MTCLLHSENVVLKPIDMSYLFKHIRESVKIASIQPPQRVIIHTSAKEKVESNIDIFLRAIEPCVGSVKNIREIHVYSHEAPTSFLQQPEAEVLGEIAIFAETITADELEASRRSLKTARERIEKVRKGIEVEPIAVDPEYVKKSIRTIVDADARLDAEERYA